MMAARSRAGSTSTVGNAAAGQSADSGSSSTPRVSAIARAAGSSRADTKIRFMLVPATMRASSGAPASIGSGAGHKPAAIAPR